MLLRRQPGWQQEVQVKAQQSLQVDVVSQFFCLLGHFYGYAERVFSHLWWFLMEHFLFPSPSVRVRVLVVLLSARTRVVMRSAERSPSVPTRECVTEWVPSAPPLSPRPISLPAMERLKSASTEWVVEKLFTLKSRSLMYKQCTCTKMFHVHAGMYKNHDVRTCGLSRKFCHLAVPNYGVL